MTGGTAGACSPIDMTEAISEIRGISEDVHIVYEFDAPEPKAGE